MKKRFLALFLALFFVFSLAACRSGKDDSLILRYDLSGQVSSLDPQFTTSADARTVLYNAMEGLYRLSEAGDLIPAGASGHTLSADGKTYTFTLRQDARWSDGSPVTAKDYVFAFQRMFRTDSLSPHAGKFASIEGASARMEGTAQPLGVSASGDYTLVIRLTEADPLFLQRLADPAAFPCKEDFYNESKGRYGLSTQTLLSNGPFVVKSWDNSASITLRPNDQYSSQEESTIDGVNFFIGRENPLEQFTSGKSDAICLSREEYLSLGGWNTASPREDTVWLLVFNTRHAPFQNETLRRAILSPIDREALSDALPEDIDSPDGLIPAAVRLAGQPYRELAGNAVFLSSQEPRDLLIAALGDLGLEKLPRIALSYPADAGVEDAAALLQKAWGESLSLYANLTPLPKEELNTAIQSGEFDLALVPISNRGDGPREFLAQLSQLFGWQEEEYLSLLEEAQRATSAKAMAAGYHRAEEWLLEHCYALPVGASSSYEATNQDLEGITFLPDGTPFFKLAHRK